MDVQRFTTEFFAMEKELNLFSQCIDGIPWWDPVRHDVFYFIYHRLAGAKLVQPLPATLLQRAIRFGVRRWMAAMLGLKIRLRRYDVLVLRTPRHISSDGNRVDVILDDVLTFTHGTKCIINTFPYYYHIKLPAKPDRLVAPLGFSNLNAEVEARFGLSLDIESLASLRFTQYRSAVIRYGRLLDQIAPKLVILVQNGIEKALFYAARQRSIPVIEAQHGLINYVHPAYSYPAYIGVGSLQTLPDVFLAFSQHWINQTNYPVAKTAIIGNRQLFVDSNKPTSNDILVISADIYEAAFEEVLLPAAAELSGRNFIYKLHPNQFGRRSEIEERLAHLPNIEVVAYEQTLRQLMQRSTVALCIQSTGVYEALQAGLVVYLLAKLDFETHADVFGHPNVSVVNDSREFVKKMSVLTDAAKVAKQIVFFQDFDPEAMTNIMNELH